MSELTLTVLQLGLLVLLWLFVLGVMGVLRGDLYGTRITQPSPGRARRAPEAAVAGPAVPPPAPPPPAATRPRVLVVVEGSLRGTTITLGSAPITIGRSPDSTLVLDDDYVSARHARLSPAPGGWMLEDLGSTNGTVLGKDQVRQARVVPLRTPVRIGRTVMELRA